MADLDNGEADFELNLGGGCWIVSLFDPVLVHTDGTTYQCTDSEDCSHYPEKAGVLIDGNAVVRYGAGAKDELCYEFEVDRYLISFDEGALEVSFSVEER